MIYGPALGVVRWCHSRDPLVPLRQATRFTTPVSGPSMRIRGRRGRRSQPRSGCAAAGQPTANDACRTTRRLWVARVGRAPQLPTADDWPRDTDPPTQRHPAGPAGTSSGDPTLPGTGGGAASSAFPAPRDGGRGAVSDGAGGCCRRPRRRCSRRPPGCRRGPAEGQPPVPGVGLLRHQAQRPAAGAEGADQSPRVAGAQLAPGEHVVLPRVVEPAVPEQPAGAGQRLLEAVDAAVEGVAEGVALGRGIASPSPRINGPPLILSSASAILASSTGLR